MPFIRGVRLGLGRGRCKPVRLILTLSILLLCYYIITAILFRDDLDGDVTLEVDEDARELTFDEIMNQYQTPKCTEKHNIVYIKMIKCASETISSVVRRFGYVRNLSFVLPLDKHIYLGWPYPLKEEYYRPTKTGEYNIMCDHVVYNEDTFSNIMPQNTVYITSIREPYSQFKSMFNYYKLQKIANVTGKDPITQYLHNLDKYENIYKAHESALERYCIPDKFSMSKNLMSFNLGFQTGYPSGLPDLSRNRNEVSKWLKSLEKRFHLIMLVEYLDESLVLLRRILCWNLQDILYHTRNVGTYHYKQNVTATNMAIYRDWSNVDFELYDHFKKIFWKKVGREGPDFKAEVDHFTALRKKVDKFCTMERGDYDVMTVVASKWNQQFDITKSFCDMFTSQVTDKVIQHYENMQGNVPVRPEPSIKFC